MKMGPEGYDPRLNNGGRLPRTLWVRIIPIAIVLSVCAGGLPAFLNRVGATRADMYWSAWGEHCDRHGTTSDPIGTGVRCVRLNVTGDWEHDKLLISRPSMAYVTAFEPWQLPLKATRDLVLLGMMSLGLLRARRLRRTGLLSSWPPPLILAIVLLAILAVVGLAQERVIDTVAGVRSFLFLPLALICVGTLEEDFFESLASSISALLSVQVVLVPWEFLFGLPVHGLLTEWNFPRRMAGTFVQPNSLGVFAAMGFAFVLAFSKRGRLKILAGGLAICLAAASGSGTSWIVLTLLLGYTAFQTASRRQDGRNPIGQGSGPPLVPPPFARLGGVRRITRAGVLIGWMVCSFGLLWTLPGLVGRSDVYESVTGRVTGLVPHLMGPPSRVAFGLGLGPGTNSLAALRVLRQPDGDPAPTIPYDSDSLLISLVLQTGLTGLTLAVLLFVSAFRRDSRARAFYIAAGLSALTLNIGELFPANILLSLALAHSFSVPASPAIVASPPL